MPTATLEEMRDKGKDLFEEKLRVLLEKGVPILVGSESLYLYLKFYFGLAHRYKGQGSQEPALGQRPCTEVERVSLAYLSNEALCTSTMLEGPVRGSRERRVQCDLSSYYSQNVFVLLENALLNEGGVVHSLYSAGGVKAIKTLITLFKKMFDDICVFSHLRDSMTKEVRDIYGYQQSALFYSWLTKEIRSFYNLPTEKWLKSFARELDSVLFSE